MIQASVGRKASRRITIMFVMSAMMYAADTLAAGRERQAGGRSQGGRPAQRLPGAAAVQCGSAVGHRRHTGSISGIHCAICSSLQVLANSLGGLLCALAARHGQLAPSQAAFCLAAFLVESVLSYKPLCVAHQSYLSRQVAAVDGGRVHRCRDTMPAALLIPGPARWESSAAARRG